VGCGPHIDYLLVKEASQSAKNTYTKLMEEYEILGQKIVITNPQEAQTASFAIQIVNEKVKEIQIRKPMLGPQQTAVLALLEIAGSLVKDRHSMDEYRRELDARCSALMTEVSQVIGKKSSIQQQAV
jgi:cell division protein ZapA (FtsZ GTPase activity inhibitor)